MSKQENAPLPKISLEASKPLGNELREPQQYFEIFPILFILISVFGLLRCNLVYNWIAVFITGTIMINKTDKYGGIFSQSFMAFSMSLFLLFYHYMKAMQGYGYQNKV